MRGLRSFSTYILQAGRRQDRRGLHLCDELHDRRRRTIQRRRRGVLNFRQNGSAIRHTIAGRSVLIVRADYPEQRGSPLFGKRSMILAEKTYLCTRIIHSTYGLHAPSSVFQCCLSRCSLRRSTATTARYNCGTGTHAACFLASHPAIAADS